MTSSSARFSWLGWMPVEFLGRWETGVSALMDGVTSLMALVSLVSSVLTEARAVSLLSVEELLDRVASVASKIRGQ
jgi:hypothetical protein